VSPKGREPWTQHKRAEALEVAARCGFAAASDATGVPSATIRSWARRAGHGVEVVLPTDGRPLSWAERQPLLLDAHSQAAAEAVQAAREAMRKGKARDAQHYAVVSGIATEKALLLGGRATVRSENYSVTATVDDAEVRELDAETERLKQELAELEAGGGDGAGV
jgi:hypothetical protein